MNGFTDDGWSLLGNDGVDDVTIMINSSPNKLLGSHANTAIFSPIGGGILCAKASMLLQVSILILWVYDFLYLLLSYWMLVTLCKYSLVLASIFYDFCLILLPFKNIGYAAGEN